MGLRVYELAKEIGWTSPELLVWLRRSGEFVRSASTTLSPSIARRVRALTPADKPPTPPPRRRARGAPTTHPSPFTARTQWTGPDPMTSKEAAQFLQNVGQDTIRQWVHRGLLPVAGRRGRANLFSAADLRAAQHAARQRDRSKTVTTRPQRELSRTTFDALVTITQAAHWTGISRSTLSSWVRRGRLRAVDTRGRTRLYRLRDVHRVARQTNLPTTWATPSYWIEEDE